MEKLNFRRIVSAATMAGAGGLALIGCGSSPEILDDRPATVIERQYDDPDFYLIGKVPYWQDEQFFLVVEQCDRSGDEFADERGCVTDSVSVSEETYDSYPDGSQITFSE